MRDGSLIARFGRARRDPATAVLEGFHPIKHALRFGAELQELVTRDASQLDALVARLAPELEERFGEAREIEAGIFDRLAPLAPSTGVMALAPRASVDPASVLLAPDPAPMVLLENPRDLGNLGACVRVAAGAGAAGVLSTGTHDPWHPDALRGAAGLHYALPVARLGSLGELAGADRPLLALDPDGDELDPAGLPSDAILAFGTERDGLSDELLGMAAGRLRIPMRPGVSSLNLATSVAAVLFSWRLAGGAPGPG